MERQRFEFGSAPQQDARLSSSPRTALGAAARQAGVAIPSGAERNPQPGGLSAWDPVCAAATELRIVFLEPARAKVVEALTVLKELSGRNIDVNDELAVDAFAYALVDLMSRDSEIGDAWRKPLLQLIAAQIFYSQRNLATANRKFFWAFLNDLALKYRGPLTSLPPGLDPLIDRFLSHYGLNGEENSDIAEGLEAILAPLVATARQFVRDRLASAEG